MLGFVATPPNPSPSSLGRVVSFIINILLKAKDALLIKFLALIISFTAPHNTIPMLQVRTSRLSHFLRVTQLEIGP